MSISPFGVRGAVVIETSPRSSPDVVWDDRPTVRAVACGTREVQLAPWVEAAGMRFLGWQALQDPHDWSSETSDVVVIDVMTEAADTGAQIRELVCAIAAADIPIVVKTTLILIEPVMQWLGSVPATILCNPRDEEAILALADLVGTGSTLPLHGGLDPQIVSVTAHPRDLGAADPARVAEAAEQDEVDQLPKLVTDPESFARQIDEFVRLRSLRSQLFGENLFYDPVWNMLLDLMIARLRGRQISVTSLCIASGVPETTALRLIGDLTRRAVLVRKDDASDGRRVFIELTNRHANAVARWLLAAAALPGRCRL